MKHIASLALGVMVWATAFGAGSGLAADLGPDRQAQLMHLLDHDCGSCHGMTRQGGLGLPLLPADLAHIPDDVLAAIILDGRPGTPMPPWRTMLSDQDAAWLACRLKGQTHAC